MRLISAVEELAAVDDEALVAASSAVSVALRTPGDERLYGAALAAMLRVPVAAQWIVELLVEVELAANAVPLQYPSGLRGGVA